MHCTVEAGRIYGCFSLAAIINVLGHFTHILGFVQTMAGHSLLDYFDPMRFYTEDLCNDNNSQGHPAITHIPSQV